MKQQMKWDDRENKHLATKNKYVDVWNKGDAIMLDKTSHVHKKWNKRHNEMTQTKMKNINRWNEDEVEMDKLRLEVTAKWKKDGKNMRGNMVNQERNFYRTI